MKRFTALLLGILFLLTCAGCAAPAPESPETLPPETAAHTPEIVPASAAAPLPEASDRELFAMDTVITLRLYGDDNGAVADTLEQELNRLDDVFSPAKETGALYKLNRFKTGSDPDIAALTVTAQELSARTDGALDITLAPLSKLWGFRTGEYRIPAAAEITDALSETGMENITVQEDGSVRLGTRTQLDFGALAKGYAAERCAALVSDAGLCGVLSLGGNVRTVGSKPDGADWRIGIQDPDNADGYLVTLTVSGSVSIVTSGDYQRYFMDENGTRYCHILDPQTGCPVQNSLRSVTVVCPDGTLADGLSTALFVMGREKALEFWRSSSDFEAVFIEADGAVTVTEGLADRAASDSEINIFKR